MRFFNADNTTPRKVDWIKGEGGFLVAALPGCNPALILYGIRDHEIESDTIAQLLRMACATGAPRNDLRGIYIYHAGVGRNAPVTKVAATNISNWWTVKGFANPSIAEEEWVVEQARLAGVA